MASDTGTPGPSDVIEESGYSTFNVGFGTASGVVLPEGVPGDPGTARDSDISGDAGDSSRSGDSGDSDTPGVSSESTAEVAVDNDLDRSLLSEEE